MSAAGALRNRARAAWGAMRARAPRAIDGAAVAREGLRSPRSRARQIVDLRRRLHALERDHALLAAHVRAITERLEGGADLDVPDRLAAARLDAVASYEHRISALEAKAPRDTPGRARRTRRVDELAVNES